VITIKAFFNRLLPTASYKISFPFITKKKYVLFRPHFETTNFNFLVGSCVLTFPSPAKTIYPGKKIDIFKTMKRDTTNDFMLWTGDYVYYANYHLNSKHGMFRRMNNQRVMFPEINQFQQSIVNYAMWDDHDYGPNNAEGDFKFKEKSKWVFDMQWPNPTRLNDVKERGLYYNFKHKDIEVMMMDCRYHKFNNDSLKQMWGPDQLNWLKQTLKQSKATFKFIVNGGQTLTKTRYRSSETLYYFRDEYYSLLNFIRDEKIEGVVFLSGDIHSSEIQKVYIEGIYPLYEYTCSALTSQMYGGFHNEEVVPGFREATVNNYGKISIETIGNKRYCSFANYNINGELNFRFTIDADMLKFSYKE
jgi:alkaline phosphatase D